MINIPMGISQEYLDYIKDRNNRYLRRIDTYSKLTDEEKREILDNDCSFCGSQRCGGIFDKDFGEGCACIDKYVKEEN